MFFLLNVCASELSVIICYLNSTYLGPGNALLSSVCRSLLAILVGSAHDDPNLQTEQLTEEVLLILLQVFLFRPIASIYRLAESP